MILKTNVYTCLHIMPEIIRVGISEAAKFFGVNPQTVRRALKQGEVTYVVIRGRYQLNFESLVKWSQKSKRVKQKLNTQGIGQYVDKWRIHNTLYSPNPRAIKPNQTNV